MSLVSRLPLLALVLALVVFSFSLFLVVTSGVGLSQPINLVFVLLMALSVALMFMAQNPDNENAAVMLWFGAGVWGAAAYLNFQMLGLPQLTVGLAAAASAFWIERTSRLFSFVGPALFIGTGLSLVILAAILAR